MPSLANSACSCSRGFQASYWAEPEGVRVGRIAYSSASTWAQMRAQSGAAIPLGTWSGRSRRCVPAGVPLELVALGATIPAGLLGTAVWVAARAGPAEAARASEAMRIQRLKPLTGLEVKEASPACLRWTEHVRSLAFI